jgi:hypothetical protein
MFGSIGVMIMIAVCLRDVRDVRIRTFGRRGAAPMRKKKSCATRGWTCSRATDDAKRPSQAVAALRPRAVTGTMIKRRICLLSFSDEHLRSRSTG